MSRVPGWLGLAGGAVLGFLLIAYLVLQVAPDLFAETDGLNAEGRSDARQGVRTASLALLAGAIAMVGAIYTARTFALNRAGQVTDRFTKAIEQLGHKELDVKLGGIYALERIARDSKEDHPQVVEVLTAYVREHAPNEDTAIALPGKHAGAGDRPSNDWEWDPTQTVPPPTDVQAALTVLGRRELANEPHGPAVMDLSHTNLRDASLHGNFAAAVFVQSDLRGASLNQADFSRASFTSSDLRHAQLTQADLWRSHWMTSDLTKAVLVGADLSRSNIAATKFTGATVDEAKWPDGFDAHAAIEDHRRVFGPDVPPD